MPKLINLQGQSFGRLKVLCRAENNSTDGRVMWVCACECGEIKAVRSRHLLNGHTRSCGRCGYSKNTFYMHTDGYIVGRTAKGEEFIFDADDFGKVKNYTWLVDGQGYVIASANRKIVKLHRLIMNLGPGLVVDHKDHNKLDNRKSNLRICTNQQNGCNRLSSNIPKYSQYKGVSWYKSTGKWAAAIKCHGRKINLGSFDTEQGAAKAYNDAASLYFGDFAT